MSKDKGVKNIKKPKADKTASKKVSSYQSEKSSKITVPSGDAKKK
jgi:hypothetical protein